MYTYTLIIFCCFVYYTYFVSTSPFKYTADIVDDVSGLNSTYIKETVFIRTVDDIKNTVLKAKKYSVPITVCGTKHSMGGQSIPNNGIRIDTSQYNNIISLNDNIVTVESGLLWYELIKYLNTFGLSPITLQSYSSFSIGGTISVNGHGVTTDDTLAKSIVSMTIIDSNGELQYIDKNHELFAFVIGGYGLFGIIATVSLQVTDNCTLQLSTHTINVSDFHYEYSKLTRNSQLRIARLDIVTFDKIKLYNYTSTNSKINNGIVVSTLNDTPNKMPHLSRLAYKWIVPSKSTQKIRHYIEEARQLPLDMSHDNVDRNQLLFESADDIQTLYSGMFKLNATHLLQEYFIPKEHATTFIKYISTHLKMKHYGVYLMNITIRPVNKDSITFLKYAKTDSYAFVMYFRVYKDSVSLHSFDKLCSLLIDITLQFNGTFYLPYRINYTKSQLLQSYPELPQFITMKQKYDNGTFNNIWYDTLLNRI